MDFIESTDTPEKTLMCNLYGKSGNIHIGAVTNKELHILQFAVTMLKALEMASIKNDLPEYYKNNKILKEVLTNFK